jgi:hypothetical protein
MSANTFRILRSALIGAVLGAAIYYDWPVLAGLLTLIFVLSL